MERVVRFFLFVRKTKEREVIDTEKKAIKDQKGLFMWVDENATIDSLGTFSEYRITCRGKMIAEKATFEAALEFANSIINAETAKAKKAAREKEATDRKKAEDEMIYAFFHERSESDRLRYAFEEFNAPGWRKRANR